LISIRDLDFRYPRGGFCLRVPTLNVDKGERIAVVGASGSGKTTLLDIIAGIRTAATGDVNVGGKAIASLSDAARRDFRIRRIGLIFQAFELLEYLTVRDNVLLPYRIGRTLSRQADTDSRLDKLAGEMGIAARLDRHPEQLSQGERQRAAICRALITAPELILADEPTGNLDPENKQRVLALLLEQVANHGATLVMVTHDHDLLEPFDRVLDMRDFHGRDAS
jgi:putative ABC transport system ATP-binding protein